MIPVYSLIIATEPLPRRVWDEIGWRGARPSRPPAPHLYGQRTADDRIVFGGRGAPYHFAPASTRLRPRPAGLRRAARNAARPVPGAGREPVHARLGRPLGIPRDWCASVGLDPATGLAWAGGYVGDGVATTNLAGRTLRDLVLAATPS